MKEEVQKGSISQNDLNDVINLLNQTENEREDIENLCSNFRKL